MKKNTHLSAILLAAFLRSSAAKEQDGRINVTGHPTFMYTLGAIFVALISYCIFHKSINNCLSQVASSLNICCKKQDSGDTTSPEALRSYSPPPFNV